MIKHIIGFVCICLFFVVGRVLSTNSGTKDSSSQPETVTETAKSTNTNPEKTVQQESSKPGPDVMNTVHVKKIDKEEHLKKLKENLPKNGVSETLFKLSSIEDQASTPEFKVEYKKLIDKLGSDPESSFEGLKESVELLSSEFADEKSRYLQLAVELDVSPDKKVELIENAFAQNLDKINGPSPEAFSKVTAFNLLIEHGGHEKAKDALEDSKISGELKELLKNELSSRNPAQK